MKKLISALVVVIVVAVGAAYIASNKVEEHYQRIVDKLNDIKGFKVSENKYEKGLFGSNGSFDLTVSKDLFYNITGEELDEDLKFKVERTISHSVLAFVNGFDIDLKISIQNEAVKKFLGSNVIATAKTKASVSGDKDVNVKFSDIDFSDKQTMSIHTKDVKFGLKLDAKDNVNSANLGVEKVVLKDLNEENKAEVNLEGVDIDTSYTVPVEISKIFKSKLAPYIAKAKIKKLALLDEKDGNVALDDLEYSSKFEVSNDLGSSNDVVKIGAVAVNKVKFTDFILDSKIANINVPTINNILDRLSNVNVDTNESIFAGLNLDEVMDQILEKNPSVKVDTLSFKNGDNAINLKLDAAINGFKSGESQLAIFDKLSLNGELSADETLAKFFDTLFPEMTLIEPTLISAGYLKEDGKKVVSKFKYDPNKKDIIFNEKVGLQNFFMGF
ncbi:Putative periplasmic protein [Campylobacter concisus UNSW3]|uniref:Putative periplasmic protein n=1 Tax=Campylobacter concisus UNSW3 TaxID=1242966 RepID=U2EW63_9BACT|nr:DUF945 family protein [Campylobacter concisus]ERJ21895.1 Putative periplasmic protein [Campylobacter concisus UNSW3]